MSSTFNDDFTLLELEQILHSREYQDQHSAGPQNEGSGVCDANDDYNRVISALRRIIHGANPSGNGNWYDAPSIGLSGLHQLTLQNSMPTWNAVFDSGSGILNVDIFDADVRFDAGRNWRFSNADGSVDTMIVSQSGALIRSLGFRELNEFTSNFAAGDTITVPNSRLYTLGDDAIQQYPNLRVFYNGQLLSPGSGVVSGDENRRDYREASQTTIVTNRTLKGTASKPGRLEFHING